MVSRIIFLPLVFVSELSNAHWALRKSSLSPAFINVALTRSRVVSSGTALPQNHTHVQRVEHRFEAKQPYPAHEIEE